MTRSTCLMHSAWGRYLLYWRKKALKTEKFLVCFLVLLPPPHPPPAPEITSTLPSCLKLSIYLCPLLNSGLNIWHVVELWEVWNTNILFIKLSGVIRLFYFEASKLFSWNYRHRIHLHQTILTDCRVIGGWVVLISEKREWRQVSMCTILRRWLVG